MKPMSKMAEAEKALLDKDDRLCGARAGEDVITDAKGREGTDVRAGAVSPNDGRRGADGRFRRRVESVGAGTTPDEVREAMREAQDADRCRQVEDALFRRARGYKVSLKKTFKVKRAEYDGNTGKKLSEREDLETGVEEVHIPADVRVCAYYLNNRDPARWREHPREEGDETLGGTVAFPDMAEVTAPPEEYGEAGSGGATPAEAARSAVAEEV